MVFVGAVHSTAHWGAPGFEPALVGFEPAPVGFEPGAVRISPETVGCTTHARVGYPTRQPFNS